MKKRKYQPEKRTRLNDLIRAPEVFLINEKGEKIGVVSLSEAKKRAAETGLDLVEIVPKAQPPVCKIIDWGKYQYQQAKKKQENAKKKKKVVVKGIRLRPNIGENDLKFKLRQAEKFLSKGHRVKVEIILRGREKAFRDSSRIKLQEFIDKIEIPFKVEQAIQKQFNGWNLVISPKK